MWWYQTKKLPVYLRKDFFFSGCKSSLLLIFVREWIHSWVKGSNAFVTINHDFFLKTHSIPSKTDSLIRVNNLSSRCYEGNEMQWTQFPSKVFKHFIISFSSGFLNEKWSWIESKPSTFALMRADNFLRQGLKILNPVWKPGLVEWCDVMQMWVVGWVVSIRIRVDSLTRYFRRVSFYWECIDSREARQAAESSLTRLNKVALLRT